MHRLTGQVQSYAWGDRSIIAEMQGREPGDQPEAELWLGAHPVAPSGLAGEDRTLADAVADEPARVLGPAVEARFGRYPYLLKILAAGEPLSIQAHPSLAQAKAGFAREDGEGVAWDSPTRTYRDDNHKPELICALTPFEAKCGFRDLPATIELVEAMARSVVDDGVGAPGLRSLLARLQADGPAATVLSSSLAWLLRLDTAEASTLVIEAVEAADRLLAAGLDERLAPLEADLVWTGELYRHYPGDPGVVVALLLNHVSLAPGEAMFLEAGNLHSYLKGAGVELMANSDNVVRGGLTVKHVDVDELVAVVDATPGPAPVQRPNGDDHRFDTPVPEFSLTRMAGTARRRLEPSGPEIVLVTAGTASIEGADGAEPLELGPGEAAVVFAADGPYEVRPGPDSLVWRATAGDLAL